jgi:hypothetical protein
MESETTNLVQGTQSYGTGHSVPGEAISAWHGVLDGEETTVPTFNIYTGSPATGCTPFVNPDVHIYEGPFPSTTGCVLPTPILGPQVPVPPEITPKLIRELRRKHFTVRHNVLDNCGHKMDLINEPANNCQNCWFNWFNIHPELVKIADEFFGKYGKGPLVAMRGEKFTRNFLRFMSTVERLKREVEERKETCQISNSTTSPVEDSGGLPSSNSTEVSEKSMGGATTDTGDATATVEL